mmetsp:Transcript_36146/g.90712  ORF Transcript_36146/g.90712 Transcript_36146/m.90712 type:complete len:226 (+) Transcript_36146:157-834(+)
MGLSDRSTKKKNKHVQGFFPVGWGALVGFCGPQPQPCRGGSNAGPTASTFTSSAFSAHSAPRNLSTTTATLSATTLLSTVSFDNSYSSFRLAFAAWLRSGLITTENLNINNLQSSTAVGAGGLPISRLPISILFVRLAAMISSILMRASSPGRLKPLLSLYGRKHSSSDVSNAVMGTVVVSTPNSSLIRKMASYFEGKQFFPRILSLASTSRSTYSSLMATTSGE